MSQGPPGLWSETPSKRKKTYIHRIKLSRRGNGSLHQLWFKDVQMFRCSTVVRRYSDVQMTEMFYPTNTLLGTEKEGDCKSRNELDGKPTSDLRSHLVYTLYQSHIPSG